VSDHDPGLWQQAANWLWGLLAIVGGTAWRGLHTRIEEKADRDDMQRALAHIETLFDKAEDDRKFTRDLFDKAIEVQRGQHAEIVRLIAEGGKRGRSPT
jgi:hypothetical protein